MTSVASRIDILRMLVYLAIVLIFCDGIHEFSDAKEIEPTKEWQLVTENDTIPSGFHVRMDMTTGEKWVKILDEEDEKSRDEDSDLGKMISVAVSESDGIVEMEDNNHDDVKFSKNSTNYNFEMMYSTLSKIPPEELNTMGGLPEFQDANNGPSREAFEERMLEIWEKRQAELLELQLNFPEILKARIAGIKEYLQNPGIQLENLDLDSDLDDNIVTDIVSLLKDLEFQLSDIDMARDFHTMNGWPLLVQLLSESAHVQVNETIHDIPRDTFMKIRIIQSHAAWAIGTAVKNTEEFFSYGVEFVVFQNMEKTTAIDLLITIFCEKYLDSGWETRTLQAKAIYAIGAILRGNHLAVSHITKTDGFDQLGKKFRELSHQGFNSVNTKLIQRMTSLSSDIIDDFATHSDDSETKIDTGVIHSISSAFCDVTCELLSSETFVPMTVQETLMKGIATMGSYCQSSTCELNSIRSFAKKILSDWLRSEEEFDADHYQDLQDIAREAIKSLGMETENVE